MNLPPIDDTGADMRRHELFADLAEQCARRLLEVHGLPLEVAADIGNALADFLASHWCGQNIYITADVPYRHSRRDLDIFQRMGRGMAHQLAAEHGISYVRVYQIYRRMLAIMRAQRQPQLFTEPTDQAPEVTATEALSTPEASSPASAGADPVIHSPEKVA